MRLLAIAAVLLTILPPVAQAAEVLQVRQPTLLQIGDGNRSVPVRLACLQVPPEQAAEAEAWLRHELPRRSRVNLRPLGNNQGELLARITRLGDASDLGSRLIAAGLAQSDPSAPGCQDSA